MRPNWQPAPPVSPFTSRAYLQNLSLSHENLYERNNSFLPTLPNDPDPIVPNTSIHLSQDPFSGYNGQNWRFAAYRQFSGLPVNNTLSAHFEGQNDSASHGPGRLIYLMPLGAGNGKGDSSHAWGDPLHSFWCCYGSGVESMAKLYDSIFFWRWGPEDRAALQACVQQRHFEPMPTMAGPLLGCILFHAVLASACCMQED